MKMRDRSPLSRQRGAATVLVALFLFLGVVLVVAYANRGAILEQRLAAADVRAKQAFAAANAGIDQALAYMQKGGIDQNSDGTPDTLASVTLTNTGSNASSVPSYYKTVYCSPNSVPPSCPETNGGSLACTAPPDFTQVMAVACGWSDDNSSVQRIVQMLGGTKSTAGVVAAPLVSQSTANLLTGGASILNYFNDLTIWTGGSPLGQSNTGKTFTRNLATDPVANPSANYRNTGNSPACNNPPPGYSCSSQGSTFGPDVVYGDTVLTLASANDFFARFMGSQPDTYRDSVATYKIDLTNTLSGADATSANAADGKNGQVVWIEATGTTANLGSSQVGTQTRPSILIVNGNLELGANAVINGLVLVTGSITANGGPTIYGALIAGGSATATGNLNIVYDPNTLAGVNNLGKAARVPGGFRDW